jgi:acyl-CoA thioesterase YciA
MSDNPQGELTTRTMAMPADSNPAGDIFGGWVLSQMDIAAGICASERAQCRTVTVALDGMHFIRPVKIGDILCGGLVIPRSIFTSRPGCSAIAPAIPSR